MATFLQNLAGKASQFLDRPLYSNTFSRFVPRFQLPDLRMSEALASYSAPKPQVQGISTQNQQPQAPGIGFGDIIGNDVGTIPTRSGGGGGGGSFDTSGQENTINQNAQDLQALADQEFEQALNILGQQEGALRGEADIGVREQRQAGSTAERRAGDIKEQDIRGLDATQSGAEKQTNLGIRQARDIFRETQQQNIAQLSGLGISSSSVAEALAERLGVETARRIGGLTDNIIDIRNNVAKEKERVLRVFRSKVDEIKTGTQLAIDKIKLGLQQGLAQIAAERGRAATAKAQARTDIAINARNMIQRIQQEFQEKQRAAQLAASKRTQALEDLQKDIDSGRLIDPNSPRVAETIQNRINDLQSISARGGLIVPQLNYGNVYGKPFVDVQGQFIPRKEEEDTLSAPEF